MIYLFHVVLGESPFNYVFVGDEAFALRPDFLKPYNQRELDNEKRIYNYRLSRARRVVENAFGILANRFRIFHTSINLKVENIEKVVLACCALHNLLRRNSKSYTLRDSTDDSKMLNLEPRGTDNTHTSEAKQVREKFKRYFNNAGKVNWQDQMVSH